MNIIFILIPLGLALLLLAVVAFFWAVRSGQFDDLDSPAWRVVLDDDRTPAAAPGSHPTQPETPGASDSQQNPPA